MKRLRHFTAVAAMLAIVLSFGGCDAGGDVTDTTNGVGNPFSGTPTEQTPTSVTIAGKSYNTGLTKLELKGEYLTSEDIEPLRHMVNLRELDLHDNEITDISVLSGLTKLRELNLYNNNIADISPLSGLVELEKLRLYNNNIVDISPLSGLVDLRELYISNNEIDDISPLNKLISLELLGLSDNKIVDISPLSELPKLRNGLSDSGLGLSNNLITDISVFVNGFIALETVNLDGNPIEDWSFATEGDYNGVWFLEREDGTKIEIYA